MEGWSTDPTPGLNKRAQLWHGGFFFALKTPSHPLRSPVAAQPAPAAPAEPHASAGAIPVPEGEGLKEEFSRSCSPRKPPCHRRKRLRTPLPPPAPPASHPAHNPSPTISPTHAGPPYPCSFGFASPQRTGQPLSTPLARAGVVGGEGKSRKREQEGECDIWKV